METENRAQRERILILGAAGRDFHNFNAYFRDRPQYQVVGFTAAQIPGIACRIYPRELSGSLYPEGLPIWPEDDLEKIILDQLVDRCILAYSDLSHQTVMDLASRVLAVGSDFGFMGGWRTMLESSKPVIAVCAVRTGAGKSPASRYIVKLIKARGLKVVVIRHPMPYGNLVSEAVQRFASFQDLDEGHLTIEEREEYEAHVKEGTIVYAGVDYEAILRLAEKEADIILWDGGNNDTPFIKPDLWITVADALRPGQELTYYPGETNFRAADIIVVAKANEAQKGAVETIEANAAEVNPKAKVVVTALEVAIKDPQMIKDKKVLVVEDGPTLTHGGMIHGAGFAAARNYGASEMVDPRPFAVGSMKEVFAKFKQIGKVLPAMGYYPDQISEVQETINKADADAVIVATPIDLQRLIKINKPATQVTYEMLDMRPPFLKDLIEGFLSDLAGKRIASSER